MYGSVPVRCPPVLVGVLPGGQGGQAEVDDLHVEAVLHHHDVAGVEVPVDDPFVVDGLERLGEGHGDIDLLVQGQHVGADELLQRAPGGVFEDDAVLAVVYGQRPAHVGAGQRLVDLELVVIASDGAGVAGGRFQRLDDHRLAVPLGALDQRRSALVDGLVYPLCHWISPCDRIARRPGGSRPGIIRARAPRAAVRVL